MTNQTAPLPFHEWAAIIRETNEPRLFRNITPEEFDDGAEALAASQEAVVWAMGVLQ